jgi:hypothetical protein
LLFEAIPEAKPFPFFFGVRGSAERGGLALFSFTGTVVVGQPLKSVGDAGEA